jgi:hypothetical protein
MKRLIILGGVLAILLLVGLACSYTPRFGSTATPTVTETPLPTATLPPTDTPEPTATPTLKPTVKPAATLAASPTRLPTQAKVASPTLVPTAASAAGYKTYQGEGVTISLPETYIGGNLTTDLDLIMANLKELGPEFSQTVTLIEQNRSLFVLWAFDSNMNNTKFLTNVNIIKQPVLSGITLKMMLDATAQSLPAQFIVTESKIITLGSTEAGRIRVDATVQGTAVKEAFYLVMDSENSMMYAITFATSASEIDDRLPTFDQSVSTFKVVP